MLGRKNLLHNAWTQVVVIFCSLCIIAIPVNAQEDSALSSPGVQRLNQLLANKDNLAAYELSASLLQEWGGDPYFDFLAGRAAFANNHFQEAVFAFERVIINEPRHLAARVLLAFSYFRVNNFGAAQVELTQLLAADLKPEDRVKVEEYLAIIAEQEERNLFTSDLTVSIGLTADSNVNSGTLAEEFFLPGVEDPIVLDNNSRERDDNVTDILINYVYDSKITQRSGYTFVASLNDVAHQEVSELDRTILNVGAGYYRKFEKTSVNFSGFLQPMQLNNELYRNAYGAKLDVGWNLSERWQLLLGVGLSQVDNKATDDQDLDQFSAKSKFTYKGESVHMFELGFGNDDAKQESGRHNGKEYWSLTYSYLRPFSQQWLVSIFANFQDIKHDGLQPFFLVAREEESFLTSLNLDYTPDAIWRFTASLTYSEKSSNINIYEYDRSAAKITATRKF